MNLGELKFINWRRVELKQPYNYKHGGSGNEKYKNRVWLIKSRIANKEDKYRRCIGISRHLLNEANFGPGTELILVRSKDLFAFKRVNSKGQFRINKMWQIQYQPLYLELMSHTKTNMFDAFIHDGMIVFHEHIAEETKEENNEL